MKIISIILIAATFLFTSCGKEPIEQPVDNTIEVHLSVINVSSTTQLCIFYGGDYGSYQTPYLPLDTLLIPFTPEPVIVNLYNKDFKFNSEYKQTYLFIKPADNTKVIWVRRTFNDKWKEYPAGYTSTISTNDSLFITITN